MGLDGVKKGIERSKKTRSAGNTIVVIAQIDVSRSLCVSNV